jgi:hypothetical protein
MEAVVESPIIEDAGHEMSSNAAMDRLEKTHV